MSEWFIPAKEEFQSQRALLNLELNRAIRYYRELVVPGIGGVWFVRQLSWAAAGIALAREHHIKPAKVANAIEALACKLEWKNDKDDYSRKGKRAFNRDRDADIWDFARLSDKAHYVQVTYRQSTVRAMTGLMLTNGTRFNTMELTDSGETIKDALLQNKVRNALSRWIKGGSDRLGLTEKSIGRNATKDEKQLIRDRLRADSIDMLADPSRRRSLIDAFGRCKTQMPDLSVIKNRLPKNQARDIEIAEAFDEMIGCGRAIVHSCARLIDNNKDTRITMLIKNQELKKALDRVARAATKFEKSSRPNEHPDAKDFAQAMLSPSTKSTDKLKNIIQRDNNILVVADGRIRKGPLFDRHEEKDEDADSPKEAVGTEESSTENKVRQLFELFGDCQ